jgi:putative ABC transport system permease protein
VRMSADSPDMFLLDIQRDQVKPVEAAIAAHMDKGAVVPPLVPVLRARVVGVAGREVNLENYEDVRGRGSLGREYTITYRSKLESNEKIVAGQMWEPTPSEEPEVSIEQFISESFKINIGDTVRFDVLGRVISAKVTSVRYVEWSDSRSGGFMFLFRPGVLEKAPHSYIGFLRGPQDLEARARLQAALVNVAPNVSVIDGREIIDAIKTVIDNVTLAVSVVGTLVVLSGLMILIGAVAMTKFRRVYEAAIFKTLGATRRLIATVLVLEYGLLGILAGGIGAAGAIGLTWAISKYALEIPFKPLIGVSAIGVVITTVLVASIGVISSWEVLQRKPLATLRAE